MKKSGQILLQRIPTSLDLSIPGALQEILYIPGVLAYSKQHFWELRQGEYVGSVLVQVGNEVDDQLVQRAIQNIFRNISVRSMTVQVEKDIISIY